MNPTGAWCAGQALSSPPPALLGATAQRELGTGRTAPLQPPIVKLTSKSDLEPKESNKIESAEAESALGGVSGIHS